jgi:hypothetical protein
MRMHKKEIAAIPLALSSSQIERPTARTAATARLMILIALMN